jgi:putative transposase
MHAYLATLCRDCGCPAYRVGGAADHVHIATRLARTLSQAELLEKISLGLTPGGRLAVGSTKDESRFQR